MQGPYLGTFQARDSGGAVLFCVNIRFRIVLGSARVSAAAHGTAIDTPLQERQDSERSSGLWLS